MASGINIDRASGGASGSLFSISQTYKGFRNRILKRSNSEEDVLPFFEAEKILNYEELCDVTGFKNKNMSQQMSKKNYNRFFSGRSNETSSKELEDANQESVSLEIQTENDFIDDEKCLSNEYSVRVPRSYMSYATDSEDQGTTLGHLEIMDNLLRNMEASIAIIRDQRDAIGMNSVVQEAVSVEARVPFVLRYQFVIITITQIAMVIILSLYDEFADKNEEGYEALSNTLAVILQLGATLLVIIATVVLSRQLLKFNVESTFLAYTYIGTILTFTGTYFITFRLSESAWEHSGIDSLTEFPAFIQYIKFFYLSVSAATLCGASNIQPREWYMILLLCFQSILNFVYFASILASTIGNYQTYTVQIKRTQSINPRF